MAGKVQIPVEEFLDNYRSGLKIKIPSHIIKRVVASLHDGGEYNENVIRSLIDNYYQKQNSRIRLANQIRAIRQGYDEGVVVPQSSILSLEMDLMNFEVMESNAKKFLKSYAESCQIGEWLLSITGIGEVIASALIAYIDINKAAKPGQIERYAGIDPTRKWFSKVKYREIMGLSKVIIKSVDDDDEEDEYNKYDDNSVNMGEASKYVWAENNTDVERTMVFNEIHKHSGWKVTNLVNIWNQIEIENPNSSFSAKTNTFLKQLTKCPYNKRLKVVCYHIAQSFTKLIHNENSFYSPLYLQRKAYETIKNENGDYANQAAEILRAKKFNKSTSAYRHYIEGKLPPAHIQMRAGRFAVKIFLNHLHYVWRTIEGLSAPKPYAIVHLEHEDWIRPPNFDTNTGRIKLPK